MPELDPKLSFDSFVVGPANRLASAAARRASETPGKSYNPLFLYSEPGLGKTHILTAVAHRAQEVDGSLKVEYMALEEYLEKHGAPERVLLIHSYDVWHRWPARTLFALPARSLRRRCWCWPMWGPIAKAAGCTR